MEWVIGSVSLLLLFSAGGLALFARQGVGPATVATKLLALYLASWSYVLGLVGLFLSLAWWLVSRRRVRPTRVALNRYSPAEPRRLEEPEPEGLQFFEHDPAPVVASRLSGQSNDRNKAISSTRVA
ncbi:MAG: hypothetical protein ACREJU_02530 [Nitrospiraceae bacterium]